MRIQCPVPAPIPIPDSEFRSGSGSSSGPAFRSGPGSGSGSGSGPGSRLRFPLRLQSRLRSRPGLGSGTFAWRVHGIALGLCRPLRPRPRSLSAPHFARAQPLGRGGQRARSIRCSDATTRSSRSSMSSVGGARTTRCWSGRPGSARPRSSRRGARARTRPHAQPRRRDPDRALVDRVGLGHVRARRARGAAPGAHPGSRARRAAHRALHRRDPLADRRRTMAQTLGPAGSRPSWRAAGCPASAPPPRAEYRRVFERDPALSQAVHAHRGRRAVAQRRREILLGRRTRLRAPPRRRATTTARSLRRST